MLLVRQVDLSLGLTRQLAGCFDDARHPVFVEHFLPELLAQRIYAEALGYEDLNDHHHLRRDPLLATACGKEDPLGTERPFHPGARERAAGLCATEQRLAAAGDIPLVPSAAEGAAVVE